MPAVGLRCAEPAASILTHDDPAGPGIIARAEVIIDGGRHRRRPPLRAPAAELIGQANATDALRVAVDLPSGIEPDTGQVRGPASWPTSPSPSAASRWAC